MAIKVLSAGGALRNLYRQFDVVENIDADKTLYTRFIRRLCAFNCPIPRGKLMRIIQHQLGEIIGDEELIQKNSDLALEGLFDAGDLLEITKFKSLDETYDGDWIFVAPPSYVKRRNGRTHIFGLAADDAPILPLALQDKIQHSGPFRFFQHADTELLAVIQSYGLREVPDSLWSVRPARESSSSYLSKARYRLAAAAPSGHMNGIRICTQNSSSLKIYRDRWTSPTQESGAFLARRPRAYGAESWCYAEIVAGEITKFVDLPWMGDRSRGCDTGWRLQLAIDAESGVPASYTTRIVGNNVVVNFSFPIPLWARRRFQLAGDDKEISNWQFSISSNDWPIEKDIIENDLWFVPVETQNI